MMWARSQREIVGPGREIIRKILQGDQSRGTAQGTIQLTNNAFAGDEMISARHKERLVYVRQCADR